MIYLSGFLKWRLLSILSIGSTKVFIFMDSFCKLVGIILEQWRRWWHPTPVLLPGKSHGWRSLVGCSPWGREESDLTERLHFHFSLLCIGEGNGDPLQCSCLENPRDRVAQSQTRLKWLSSSILEQSLAGRGLTVSEIHCRSLCQWEFIIQWVTHLWYKNTAYIRVLLYLLHLYPQKAGTVSVAKREGIVKLLLY